MNTTNKSNLMLLSGTRLKECRKAAGLTQTDLISKIEALPENKGKARNEKHLSAIECGKRSLSPEYARLISLILNVRSEYLLGYDNVKTVEEYIVATLDKVFDSDSASDKILDCLHNYLLSTNFEVSFLFEGSTAFIPATLPSLIGRITIPVWGFKKDDLFELHTLEAINVCIDNINKTFKLNEYLTLLQTIEELIRLNVLSFLQYHDRNISNAKSLSLFMGGFNFDSELAEKETGLTKNQVEYLIELESKYGQRNIDFFKP